MKKTICSIGAFTLLLVLTMLPSINGTILGGTVNTTEEYMIEEEIHNTETIGYGSIYGETYGLKGWMFYPLSGVHIEARIGITTVGMDTSTFLGKYRIRMLPLGYSYTVTASYPEYDIDTAEITLTSDEPHVKVNFGLERNDEYDVQIKSTTNPTSQPVNI